MKNGPETPRTVGAQWAQIDGLGAGISRHRSARRRFRHQAEAVIEELAAALRAY
jgi:hypothetical protein